jgi:PEP-CTERM motif
MKTNLLMTAVAAGVLGLSVAAYADTVTVIYSGSAIEITPGDGIPPASEGESLVATYVFNLPNATDTMIDQMTGGFAFGPYGSFATASLTVGGVAALLPAFANGELTGETHVFETGSVLDAEVTGADPATQLISLVDGMDFSWNLGAPTNISFSPAGDDDAITQFKTAAGGFLESDVTSVSVTVSSSSPVPEPSTWAMMLIGFAGFGVFTYRRKRAAATLAA